MAACAQRAQLTNELIPLQTDRDRLREIIKNFGFENIAAQQEALGQKADDILRDHGANAAKDYREKSLDEAKTLLDEALKNINNAPFAGNSTLSPKQYKALTDFSKHVPADQQSAFKNAVTQLSMGRSVPEAHTLVYTTVLKAFGTAMGLVDIATTESQAEQAWKGAMMMAGEVVSGPVAILIAEADYARKNLFDLGTLAWTQYKIHKLATMTEGDLKLLKGYASQMATVGKRIGELNRSLVAAPPCDSTQLAGKLEQIDPTPTPQPKSGGSPAKLIGALAAAGGAGLGVYYALDAASAAAAGSSLSGGSSGGSSGGGSGGGSVTASSVTVGGFSCTAANSTSNFRTCQGTIIIKAGTALAARQGTSLAAVTNPSSFSASFVAPGLGGSTGTLTMRATVASCPTQTVMSFLTVGGSTAIESINVSIPLSCP